MKKLLVVFIVFFSLLFLYGLYIGFIYYQGGNGYGIRYFQAKKSEVVSVSITPKLLDYGGKDKMAMGLVLKVLVKVNSPLILKDVKNGKPLKVKPSSVHVITPDGSRHSPFYPIGEMYIEKVSEGVYRFTEEQRCGINIYSPEYCQDWANEMSDSQNQYQVGLSYFGNFLRYFVLNANM